ncbi:amino acid adenylation domain-containing protein [Streptomyces sp. NBC_01255]|uniref:non-ribosomal peptide synthetase family protein n=1 Tax=Streptomyces sp. NBC_01255 TaxID=2903798 RepID=UPI002E2EF6F2|nr:amino acid adenylation domain-containing protein [Streptomyces sp. NBC_01255]
MSTLDQLLRAEAQAHPHATAVRYEDETLTFHELTEGATVLATYLRTLGATTDTRIGVHVDPSLELVIGAWGVICSGAAYVPLSPEYPEERLRYMIEDSGARIVFTQERFSTRVAELAPPGTTVVTLKDAVQHAWRTAGEEPTPYDDIHDTDLAYVIYTSGSTGRPKGVMIEHRSIVAQMRWMAAEHHLGPAETVLQKTPMSFDAAQWEILAPAVGARVAVGPPGVYRDPEALIDTVRAHGATMLQGVPTLLQALVDTERLATCTTLRRVYSGGEILSRNLATRLLTELPDAELINLYGPTECTINASSHTVDRASLSEGPSAIPIGRPAYDTTFHIRDGELCIGGIQVARGYLDRPELTADRFLTDTETGERLYRTGDLAHWNDDGTVQFAGRADNQIKLRGFRVELDEIALAIENHDWVKNAAVIVKNEPRTGFQNLVACVELSPKEAALMDQGNHGAHHQSKESKLQVKAQLSNAGTRDDADLAGRPAVALPGRTPTARMRRTVFARKTYRFYEGGDVTRADVLAALARRPEGIGSRAIGSLTTADLGELLRWFGQFTSAERLLPKYGYASPGALYATQLYVEARGIAGLDPGTYYYHPVRHQLYLTAELAATGDDDPTLRLSFRGKRSAIEPVYKNNIQEVLEIETGHMVGLFEEILPGYGLDLRPGEDEATFEVVPYDAEAPGMPREVDVYVQSHPQGTEDLPPAQYAYEQGNLLPISDSLIEKKHVIAINQAVYERAALGITVISRTTDTRRAYVDLGRALQRLQLGDHGLGFMSSGYSSKTGHPLPAARRMDEILTAADRPTGPSYFFVGGRVSEEQRLSEGMYEDTVHMKGPAEMIRDDLVHHLPDYMIPNRVVVLDRLPLSANGKVDAKALGELAVVNAGLHGRPHVLPRTRTESRLTEIWAAALKYEEVEAVSVLDDFFESGGNSLIAVALITKINREFGGGVQLPLQILFESPTIEKLAHRVDGAAATPASRLVRLHAAGAQSPVYCWPGLGGYTMNLRHLAEEIGIDRPFYGVQAYGINRGEEPYATIREMAAADVAAIRRRQPTGPYTLWGYSFGARVAFESAHLLEAAGEQVENLFLIAPGSPKVRSSETGGAAYDNPAFVTILYSVFAGTIDATVKADDRDSFVALVADRFPSLDPDLISRIVAIVEETFDFTYTFKELTERQVACPVTLFKAEGDDYSFLENTEGWSTRRPTVVELDADHYSLLRRPDLKELVKKIRYRLGQ